MTPVVCQAPGKLVLFGEFAVLAGHQALVASVSRFAQTTISASDTFKVQAEHFGTFNEKNIDRAPSILKRVCSRYAGSQISIETNTKALYDHQLRTPRKLGLGSSAAVTTTLLQALHSWHDESLTPEHLFRKTFDLHHGVQGTGSGVDIAAAVFGGTIAFSRADLRVKDDSKIKANQGLYPFEIRSIQTSPSLVLLGVFIGKPQSTGARLDTLRSWQQESPNDFRRQMSALGELSREAIDAWESQNFRALTSLARLYVDGLKTLGDSIAEEIIPPQIAHLNQTLRPLGTTAKTTGAGGGDMAWVLCEDSEHRRDCIAKLQDDFAIYELPISPNGVSVKHP